MTGIVALERAMVVLPREKIEEKRVAPRRAVTRHDARKLADGSR